MGDEPAGQEALWELLDRGVIEMLPLGSREVPRIRERMRKYRDRPMEMADAALVSVAERESTHTIFTIDKRDFRIYRLRGRLQFTIIP